MGGQKRRIKMAQVNETYLCEICGNKVKVIEAGGGELVCCGEAMTKVE
jgi:desulfoferrodoxin-like iron-binding protein